VEIFLLHHPGLAEGELALVAPRPDVEILPLVLLLLAHLLHPLLQHTRQVLEDGEEIIYFKIFEKRSDESEADPDPSRIPKSGSGSYCICGSRTMLKRENKERTGSRKYEMAQENETLQFGLLHNWLAVSKSRYGTVSI
jgi:hypothetical protein